MLRLPEVQSQVAVSGAGASKVVFLKLPLVRVWPKNARGKEGAREGAEKETEQERARARPPGQDHSLDLANWVVR